MRDWRDVDPGYSPNDSRHPRNRPAGAGAGGDALEVDPEVAAGLIAGLRALASAGRAPAARPAVRGPRHPDGRPASLAERQAAYEAFERTRQARLQAYGRELAVLASAPPRPGKVCRWW